MTTLFAPPPVARFVVSAPRCSLKCAREPHADACGFKVAWQINPHMRVGAAEPRHAARQHGVLTQLLQTLGARVEGLPFVHGAYDSVFVKDNALLIRRHGVDDALLARPRHPERRMEQHDRREALERRGFRVRLTERAVFEGGDLVLLPSARAALLGTGFRSEKNAADEIERFVDVPIHALELRDSHLYHLDTALAALSDGTIAFCPEAFTYASLLRIERLFSADCLLRVPYDDARAFALNVIEVGRHVIMGGPSTWLQSRLEERGWIVHVPELHQFRCAGGSAACLVARVHGHHTDLASSRTTAMRSTAA
jgi:N-dimethylarginine dimethylaminohydrolase